MRVFEHFSNGKIVAIVGVVLVGVLSAYLYSFSGAPQNAADITSASLSPIETVLGRDLLSALATLKSTKLDTSIFDDPVFESLRDFSVKIAPLPVGRRNPFAPFEEASKAKGGSTKKTSSSGGSASKPARTTGVQSGGSAPEKGATVEGFDL